MADKSTRAPLVTLSDVRTIDADDGLVRVSCGVQLEAGQVRKIEEPGDRTDTGGLSDRACERIAVELSEVATENLRNRKTGGAA